MRLNFTFFILTLLSSSTFGQINDDTIRLHVLEKRITDSTYIFGKWSEEGKTETHLTYLGEIKTVDGRIFKIMNSYWVWGLSHRATSRILIYNERDRYLGNYLVAENTLPFKLEGNYLFFQNTDSKNCDKNNITKINFNKRLPKMIFIKCKDESGDCYLFE